MGTIKHFTDLEAWKEAHKLTLLVYKYTALFPKYELFGIVSQLRRAAVSIESCIAEGFSRYHFKDRLNFYYDARGSIAEVQTQLLISRDLGYLDLEKFNEVYEQSKKVAIILGGLITSTERLSQEKNKKA